MYTIKAQNKISTQDNEKRYFYIIASGTVFAKYGRHTITLSKGDVAGIFDMTSDTPVYEYIAATDASLIPYTYENNEALLNLFNEQPDLCKILLHSINSHICKVLEHYENVRAISEDLYKYINLTKSRYQTTCKIMHIEPRPLPFEQLAEYTFESSVDTWLVEYYEALGNILNEQDSSLNVAFTYGHISKLTIDIRQLSKLIDVLEERAALLASHLLNNSYNDFYDLYCDLYIKTQANGGDTTAISNVLSIMTDKLNSLDYIDRDLLDRRVTSFKSKSIAIGSDIQNDVEASIMHAKLAGALNEILEFADTVPATATEFKKCIDAFKALSDKDATDEETNRLRQNITKLFNIIYTDTMQNALKTSDIPTIIKMFLNFGFVDTALAGSDNAIELYKLSGSFKGNPKNGIYTALEWFQAILAGNKQPSRDEFERDYSQFVRSLITEGKITKASEKAMLEDGFEKVLFELNNMFPSANKITHGRIFTFCPLLTSDNLIRQPASLLLTPTKLLDALDKINDIDYSLFYHEYMFEEYKLSVKDTARIDIRPDMVLLPNVGSRGAMWQEIEGPSRKTPARFFMPVFFVENIDKCMLRLVAEYRWEMCKRDMGARWNDVTSHCLTAEYYDYVQFISKNRELSNDAKDKVKDSLKKCRNSFKEMFINDYIQHILYETNGSCRLNKVARGLLFTFCPPAKKYRDRLAGNSIYEEGLRRVHISTAQALHRIDVIETKYKSSGTPFPEELSGQRELLSR